MAILVGAWLNERLGKTEGQQWQGVGCFLIVYRYYIDFHIGLNYCLENNDRDKDLNLFTGFDISFSKLYKILFELDNKIKD